MYCLESIVLETAVHLVQLWEVCYVVMKVGNQIIEIFEHMSAKKLRFWAYFFVSASCALRGS